MKRFSAGALALWVGLFGCNGYDDQPSPVPTSGGSGGPASPGSSSECAEAAAIAGGALCSPGQNFWFEWDGPDYNMTLIDDPVATLGVGPNAWLVQASSSADWIGDYEGSDGSCDWGCSWCEQGQSLCHGGFEEDGTPSCFLCLPTDNSPNGIAAMGQACSDFVSNNASCGGMPPGGGSSGTGGGADGGGADDSSGGAGAEYDCGLWNIAGAASVNRTTIEVDEATLEEVVQSFGAPLTDCDDTRFTQDSSGHFVLTRVSSGGLLSQMGLQAGDRIETVNGSSILSLDDAADLVMKLFYSGSEPAKSFKLGVRRTEGRKTTFTEYKVVATTLPT